MKTFDFINNKQFRTALENDYAEMHRCAEVKAWKSCHVLAGSIVEALLIDYLTATSNSARPQKDPLKMDLSEVIEICKSEVALTNRTADLCSVIRSYRNLIHPGRIVRLEEEFPSEKSAQIALALVDLIVKEIAKIRSEALGLTAEQILTKLKEDENSLSILTHLLSEATESERERLLLELIPEAYFDLNVYDEFIPPDVNTLGRLKRAYRITIDNVTDDVRGRAAEKFVQIMRSEDGYRVSIYCDSFFRPKDLQYLSTQSQTMVRDYLLGRVGSSHTAVTLRYVNGIAEHLTRSEVDKWIDPFISTLVSSNTSDNLREKVRNNLLAGCLKASEQVFTAIGERLEDWVGHLKKYDKAEQASAIEHLKEEIELQNPPF